MEDRLLTIDEMKKFFNGMSNDAAYKLVQKKGFPAFRIGQGQWQISEKGLVEWYQKVIKAGEKTVSLSMATYSNLTVGNTGYTAAEFLEILELLNSKDD